MQLELPIRLQACAVCLNFLTVTLFSLYLMNFMFHTMLDAACVLRVHYKSMKCDASFYCQSNVQYDGNWVILYSLLTNTA